MNTAKQRNETPCPENGLVRGKVAAVLDDKLIVALEYDGKKKARRAAGCLLCPEPGDTVLVWPGPDAAYVLSVLEKAGTDSRLAFSGDKRDRTVYLSASGVIVA